MKRSTKSEKKLKKSLHITGNLDDFDIEPGTNDFLAQIKQANKETSVKKKALHKWGADFAEQRFEPLPRVLLENMDVFQFRGSELAILIQILMWWSDETRWPTCYYDSIASRTGLSNRIVMDNLKRLEEKIIKVPKIEFSVVKGKGVMSYAQVRWKETGILKRLKYSELPEGMKGRNTTGARYFDLSNLISICEYLIKQQDIAKEAAEQINKARQTKSAEDLVNELMASNDYKDFTRFLRKHQ